MERNKIYSPLNDKELVKKANWWIQELIKSGGKDFVMHVPAQLDHDTDLVFYNLTNRFESLLGKYEALKAKCDKYEAALKRIQYLEHNSTDTLVALVRASEVVNKALSAGEGEKEAENG